MTIPRLGIFCQGDTVDDARRRELQELPGADKWIFRALGGPRAIGEQTHNMRFTLEYRGPK